MLFVVVCFVVLMSYIISFIFCVAKSQRERVLKKRQQRMRKALLMMSMDAATRLMDREKFGEILN